ncbi:50S ribosomal protein L19 [Candidatus Latescibacterota bacterium]
MHKIDEITKSQIRNDIPEFSTGDNIDVHVRVVEGDKERTQIFSGTVIQRRGNGISETFTVRKISSGIGVERIFPLNSPMISEIKKNYSNKVRRSKLYYLRKLRGKASRLKREYS